MNETLDETIERIRTLHADGSCMYRVRETLNAVYVKFLCGIS